MEDFINYEKIHKEVTEYLTKNHNEDYTKALNGKSGDYQTALKNCRSAIHHFITHSNKIPISFNNEETIEKLFNDILLYGPVTPLVVSGTNQGISEVRIYGPYDISVQKPNGWVRLPIAFRSEEDLARLVNKIEAHSDVQTSDLNGFTDKTSLPTGERVTIFRAPNTRPTYYISIRVKDKELFSSEELRRLDSISERQDSLVTFSMRSKGNSAWVGPQNSGKTTTMGAYLAKLPKTWNILTIEDIAEFFLSQRNPELIVSELYVHNGDFSLTWEKVGVMSLRTAATVIFWGELRESQSYYRAIDNMLTGQKGSGVCTHAGNAEEGIIRLANRYHEAMPSTSYDHALKLVCDAIDFIPEIRFSQTGKRYMGNISAISWDKKRKEPLIEPMIKRWFDKNDQAHEEYLGIPDFFKKNLLATNAVFEEDFLPWEI